MLFHCDAVQALPYLKCRADDIGADLISISAHKMYGPKGVGALYLRSRRPRVRLEPILHGGGHERGLRSGTLPVASIVGLSHALALCVEEREPEAKRLCELRDLLLSQLSHQLDGVRLNGHPERRLPGNLNVSFEGVDADRLLLSLRDIAVSTGSACSSARPEPSHVLAALGLPEPLARASIRFGLGRGTTRDEIERAAERVRAEVIAQRSG